MMVLGKEFFKKSARRFSSAASQDAKPLQPLPRKQELEKDDPQMAQMSAGWVRNSGQAHNPSRSLCGLCAKAAKKGQAIEKSAI